MLSPSNQSFRTAFIMCVSLMVAACGGGGSGGGSDKPSGEPAREQSPQSNLVVQGSAVKGVIKGGVVTLWKPVNEGNSWQRLGDEARTDATGHFEIAFPDVYAGSSVKVVLRSDSATQMRCDVRPVCGTPGGGAVQFGEWFWPGNDLELITMVYAGSQSASSAILSPLGTLAFELAKSEPGEFNAARYIYARNGLEHRIGLEKGILGQPQIDFSNNASLIESDVGRLKSSMINAGFLSLISDGNWSSLGQVLRSFRTQVRSSGSLELEDAELLLLIAHDQAGIHLQSAADSSVRARFGRVQGDIEDDLFEIRFANPEPEPQPAPQPAPSPEPQPEPDPEPQPAPVPEPDQEPAPSPEPQPEPDPAQEEGADPAQEQDPVQGQDPAEEQDPNQQPEPVTGTASLSWQAPLTRANGESLSMGEIDSYVVRYGTEEDVVAMQNEVIIDDGQVMEFEIADLSEGIWYFAIQTVDVNGLASSWSGAVSKTITR